MIWLLWILSSWVIISVMLKIIVYVLCVYVYVRSYIDCMINHNKCIKTIHLCSYATRLFFFIVGTMVVGVTHEKNYLKLSSKIIHDHLIALVRHKQA